MPKDFFKLEQITKIPPIHPGREYRIHLIGICGVAMGQLAVALKKQGYLISGSDKEFYEPMGSLLKSETIPLFNGYADSNITKSNPDLVVIGNAISYENPEVQIVEQKKIPYTCFPQALYECLIQGKHSIVVSGTHGKSTTTSLIAHLLQFNGYQPSYFVGGVLNSSDSSFTVTDGKHSVVEGDEYDSAFFAKTPKFSFYRANTLIINALEFDHADIYPSLDAIDQEFRKEIERLSQNDRLIFSADDLHLQTLVNSCKTKCKIFTFGSANNSSLKILSRTPYSGGQIITLQYQGESFEIDFPLPGIYNARNLAAACLATLELGLNNKELCIAAKKFTSVKRRFEKRLETEQAIIIEDFAHHPTAIKEAIQAAKETFPERRLISVFEPRSNTSRRAAFHAEYLQAFQKSDISLIASVIAKPNEKELTLLDTTKLCKDLQKYNTNAESLNTPEEIFERIKSIYKPKDVIIIMSNGSFGGLIQKLIEHFKALSY